MRSFGRVMVAACVLLGACSGGDDGSVAETPPASETSDDSSVTPTTEASRGDATSDSSPVSTSTAEADVSEPTTAATTPPTTPPTTDPPRAFFGDFETVIVQRTPESGGGLRPELSWIPVATADHYGVYVYAPSGDAYWSWRGFETSVFVGGAVQLADTSPGPAVAEGMTWAVIAYDADLLPVAASPIRPLSP